MSKKIHSQDFNFDEFKKIWEEMEKIEPLTPIVEKSFDNNFYFDKICDPYELYWYDTLETQCDI